MGCPAGNNHDPAISRADTLPIAGAFAPLDLVHIQHGRRGAARCLVTQPESGADPLPDWHRIRVGATQLAGNCDRFLRRQVGEPQYSGRRGERRVTEPLGFGVAAVGAQR
jgi:hypothetical protein